MNILLFSDLHGRILLAFKLVQRFQKERGINIDLILQCGDLGIFPDTNRLDKATIKHAKNDPSELGFSQYFVKKKPKVQKVLQDINTQMICVRGNHEDHPYLDQLEQKSPTERFTVDCYQKISICKTGELLQISNNTSNLNIVGIGRIGKRDPNREDQAIHIQDYERVKLQKLMRSKTPIDILITHDSAVDFVTLGYGMDEIREFLDSKKPHYHFFGHTGTPCAIQTDTNGATTSVKIAELEFKAEHNLPYGCMMYLNYQDKEKPILEVVEDEWLKEYQKTTWQYM